MNEYDMIMSRIARDIDTVGWAGIGVVGDHTRPSFHYTIGLDMMGLPEMLSFGLPPDRAHMLVYNAVDEMMKAVPADKTVTDKLANLRMAYCFVDPKLTYQDYMIKAEQYYGAPPKRVVQLVWSDVNNVLPFEAGCDPKMIKMQSWVRDYASEVGHAEV